MAKFIITDGGDTLVNVSQLIRIGFSYDGVTYDNAHPRQQGGCTTYICHCSIEHARIIFDEIVSFLDDNKSVYNAGARCHELQMEHLAKKTK